MGTASATTTLLGLGFVLALEAVCLFLGQRRLFWLAVDATGSRLLGYLLAMPGTVLHESAHYLACVILRVPAGRQLRTRDGRRARVRLFYPQRDPVTGSVILGMVPHAKTDPVRGALIAIAPLLVIWCGYGLPTVIASAFIVSLFPMIANTLAGLLATDRDSAFQNKVHLAMQARGFFDKDDDGAA